MVQTIRFLPDRLNAEPVVFRGFTTPELGWTALTGLIAGAVIGLLLAPVTGWVMIPTVALIAPLLLIAFGGKYLARMKRGKPAHYRKRPVISPCSSSPAHARYRFLIFTWRLTP